MAISRTDWKRILQIVVNIISAIAGAIGGASLSCIVLTLVC